MSHTMKIWERIIENRVREETSIGKEQFGFMPGRSTIDAVFAIRQLVEKHREKEKALHMVLIDLEKVFDSVPRQVWRCMREKGVQEKYVRIVQDMYRECRTQVRSSIGLTEWLQVGVGLRQGSALSPYLFDLVMDVISEKVRELSPWCMMFADDVVICSTNRNSVELKLENWRHAVEARGLKISRKKMVYLPFYAQRDYEVDMETTKIEKVEKFKYLGSIIMENGDLEEEVTHRVQGWNNWKKVSGVLCDRKIKARMKVRVYKTVVRPALMYENETWPSKKAHEKRLDVAEMRMLRWMCGVTKKDRTRNERIRGTVKIMALSKKSRKEDSNGMDM